MKGKLLNKPKYGRFSSNEEVFKSEVERGEMYYLVPQTDAADYNIAFNGDIANDLTTILHPKDSSDLQQKLLKLKELPTSFADSSLSDQQIFDQIVPRIMQTPSDLIALGRIRADMAARSMEPVNDPSVEPPAQPSADPSAQLAAINNV